MTKLTLTLGVASALLFGCAGSLPRALDKVQVGMDKDRVLELAGSPPRTFRQNGQDHWSYVYYVDDRQLHRDLIFEEGKLVKITRALASDDPNADLEKAQTMEEFEQRAREHQKKAADFKPVDGSPDDKGGE